MVKGKPNKHALSSITVPYENMIPILELVLQTIDRTAKDMSLVEISMIRLNTRSEIVWREPAP